MAKEINAEALIDQCWQMLNRRYEITYGQRNYGYKRPEFEFVLSAEEISALRKYVTNMPTAKKIFIGIDNDLLFGHPIRAQQRTPYLEPIMPQ